LKKFSSYGIDCVNIRLNINKKKTEITNKQRKFFLTKNTDIMNEIKKEGMKAMQAIVH
jgi:hypothetical protein